MSGFLLKMTYGSFPEYKPANELSFVFEQQTEWTIRRGRHDRFFGIDKATRGSFPRFD